MKTGRPSQNLVWRNEIRSWILKPSTQWFAELNKTQKLDNRRQDLKSREILEKVGRLWACGSEPAGSLLSVRVLRWIQMDSTQKQLFFLFITSILLLASSFLIIYIGIITHNFLLLTTHIISVGSIVSCGRGGCIWGRGGGVGWGGGAIGSCNY